MGRRIPLRHGMCRMEGTSTCKQDRQTGRRRTTVRSKTRRDYKTVSQLPWCYRKGLRLQPYDVRPPGRMRSPVLLDMFGGLPDGRVESHVGCLETQGRNFRYPCSPGECYNVPGGKP